MSWESGVFALQALCDPSSPSLWPGGQTALALQGFAHYLAMGQEVIHLFGTRGGRLPSWFHDAQWRDHTVLHTKRGLPENLPDSFTAYDPPRKGFTLQISTPERAILEWVAITPNELLFSDKMVDTFDGLNTLRPGRLQALLEGCRSVRAKRAFLVLARHAGHAWFDRLDQQRLDLGLGKRQLWPNGRLDKEYLVTIPERFAHER